MQYAKHYNPTKTPQTEKAAPTQVKNSAGGYSFAVDDWKRLERFLILGSEGGSYYASERALTRENAKVVERCCDADPERAVRTIAAISMAGRAPKNDAAIFALALAASMPNNAKARHAALGSILDVCRIGTHLFQFAATVSQFRGWGRGLRAAVAEWYMRKTPDQLAYQVAKYGQRDGWSHRDLLRLCHVSGAGMHINPVLRYATTGFDGGGERYIKGFRGETQREYPDPGALPDLIHAFEEAKSADAKRTIKLICEYGLTHEMIRTEHKNDPAVWEALLENMPMTAMIRNLGKMSNVGLLRPMTQAAKTVASRLTNIGLYKRARIHPIQLLSALSVYRQGHGDKGSLSWSPVGQVVDALNEGFYASFGTIEPSGKRSLLCLDVSASMTWPTSRIGSLNLTAREASACMAMVTARTEPMWEVCAFSGDMVPIGITPSQRLDDVIRAIERIPAGGTDCSLPMHWAVRQSLGVDTFVVYTDNETSAGGMHPHQALTRYRQGSGIPAKLAVVGMVSNGFTIADPNDSGMLDLVGFDSNAPAVLADFSRGEVVANAT